MSRVAAACALLVGIILITLACGCASATDAATRVANSATVILVEGRPLVEQGIERDVEAGTSGPALEARWRPIVTTFDRLVDVTMALRAAVKTARSAERAGKDPDAPHLLALAAEASSAIASLLLAFPELKDLVPE